MEGWTERRKIDGKMERWADGQRQTYIPPPLEGDNKATSSLALALSLSLSLSLSQQVDCKTRKDTKKYITKRGSKKTTTRNGENNKEL